MKIACEQTQGGVRQHCLAGATLAWPASTARARHQISALTCEGPCHGCTLAFATYNQIVGQDLRATDTMARASTSALLQQGVAALLLLVALIAGGVRAGAWLHRPAGVEMVGPARAPAPPPISCRRTMAGLNLRAAAAPTYLTGPSISLCAACPSVSAGVLKKHNAIRALHSAPPLVWDAAIAKRAQGHANKCKWGHSSEQACAT